LEGKRALIFGGTSGLGKSIALGFAEAGADVVPVSRRPEEVHKTATAWWCNSAAVASVLQHGEFLSS
jgi:NAD(P)-dependent dehydrogenase (short-subunit alcohol dehydrogenase family)